MLTCGVVLAALMIGMLLYLVLFPILKRLAGRVDIPLSTILVGRITIDGTAYEMGLAGENVTLLWGLFDNDLYVEYQDERFGPFHPISGPIPLHRYHKFKKSKADKCADRIEQLATKIDLPIAALTMEEIGYRSTVFSLDGIAGSQREYIRWLLQSCSDGKEPESIITDEAIDLLPQNSEHHCR